MAILTHLHPYTSETAVNEERKGLGAVAGEAMSTS